MNCWEYKKCGREAGGHNVEEYGVCPAYPYNGESCARVAGTLSGGKIQGTDAIKLGNCLKCAYYMSEHYDRMYKYKQRDTKSYTGPERNEERTIAFKPICIHGIDESYLAISVNYSKSGLALITNLGFSPGDILRVSCDSFWDIARDGVVTWEALLSSNSKKVGLSLSV